MKINQGNTVTYTFKDSIFLPHSGSVCAYVSASRDLDSTNDKSCESISLTVEEEVGSPTIYPNPSTGHVWVSASGQYVVYTLTGNLVFSGNLGQGESINLSQLPPSTYIVYGPDQLHLLQRLILIE